MLRRTWNAFLDAVETVVELVDRLSGSASKKAPAGAREIQAIRGSGVWNWGTSAYAPDQPARPAPDHVGGRLAGTPEPDCPGFPLARE